MKYFKNRNVNLFPYFAFFNDYYLAKSYLSHTLSREMLCKASKELFLYYVESLISSVPKNYICPQLSTLTIDEYCNITQCCIISKANAGHSLGSLFELSKDEIIQKRHNQGICVECMELGISQWISSVYCPNFIRVFNNIKN